MKLIAASFLVVILVATGAWLLPFAHNGTPETLVRAELAGAKFVYARAYARDESTAVGGMADRLSFITSYPAFAPLSANRRAAPQAVTLTLTSSDESLDPGERPAKLYARFLSPETREGPGGLVVRRFEAGSPYDSEELFIAPPDGRSFFARCPIPQSGAPGEGCLSVFRDGNLDIELRYPPAFLDRWEGLYDGARALLTRMTSSPLKKQKR